MGSHLLDVARFLFGEAFSVHCQTQQVHRDIKGEDVATVLLKMQSGATVLCQMAYEFFTDPASQDVKNTEQTLSVQFQEFSKLLELSLTEQGQAELILRSKDIDPRDIVPILTRYAKEGKRIQVDMKHEREQKILSVRHRLESELVDGLPISTNSETIAALVDAVVPPSVDLMSALPYNQRPLQLLATDGGSMTINIKP